MKEQTCIYCEPNEELKTYAILMGEFPFSRVYLHTDNRYPGRSIVVLKEHYRELFELPPAQLAGYMHEVALVAKAIQTAVNSDKINYAVYGDVISHVHFHLVPKFRNGTDWNNAFKNISKPTPMTAPQIAKYISAISSQLWPFK